jgi:HEAT repeat protein
MSNTICTSACLLCAMACGPAGVGNFVTSEDPWARPLSDLRNPDPEVRRAAAEAIMKRAAIEGFGVKLPGTPRSKPDPDHAEAAGRHIAALVSTIGDKAEDVNVRSLLVRAIQLGRYGEKGLDAVPCLIKVLRDETDNADVRSSCATVLPDLSRSKEVGQAILAASRSLN